MQDEQTNPSDWLGEIPRPVDLQGHSDEFASRLAMQAVVDFVSEKGLLPMTERSRVELEKVAQAALERAGFEQYRGRVSFYIPERRTVVWCEFVNENQKKNPLH